MCKPELMTFIQNTDENENESSMECFALNRGDNRFKQMEDQLRKLLALMQELSLNPDKKQSTNSPSVITVEKLVK